MKLAISRVTTRIDEYFKAHIKDKPQKILIELIFLDEGQRKLKELFSLH